MEYSLITDKEAQFEAMHAYLNQRDKKKHTTVKLPCCRVSIELQRPEDTYVECPKCNKKYLISYSLANSKLYSE